MNMALTSEQRALISLSLRLGAETYRKNALYLQAELDMDEHHTKAGYRHLIERFTKQYKEAVALADSIDNALGVTIHAKDE